MEKESSKEKGIPSADLNEGGGCCHGGDGRRGHTAGRGADGIGVDGVNMRSVSESSEVILPSGLHTKPFQTKQLYNPSLSKL
jgi:hypothetical protein